MAAFRLLTLCFWFARASAKSVFLAVRPDAPVGEAKDHGLAMVSTYFATRDKGDGNSTLFIHFTSIASGSALAALRLGGLHTMHKCKQM